MVQHAVATYTVGETFVVGAAVDLVAAGGIGAVQGTADGGEGRGGVVAAGHVLGEITGVGCVASRPVACCGDGHGGGEEGEEGGEEEEWYSRHCSCVDVLESDSSLRGGLDCPVDSIRMVMAIYRGGIKGGVAVGAGVATNSSAKKNEERNDRRETRARVKSDAISQY